jgi:hypothetical protein
VLRRKRVWLSSDDRPAGGRAAALVLPADSPHESSAQIRFDVFLLCAAATVLITRAILAATGYPQIGGGGSLHIAHVLWGGLLMAVAVVVTMVSTSSPARMGSAFLGGIGFGLFVDEVGKFITKDVNYFYRPAVAVIYAVLIAAYLLGRELIGRLRLSPSRVRVLALQALIDRETGALSVTRRDTVLALLQQLPPDPTTAVLTAELSSARTKSRRSAEELISSVQQRSRRFFVAAARKRWLRNLVLALMTLQAFLSLVVLMVVIVVVAVTDVGVVDLDAADFASLAGTLVQTLFITAGLIQLRRHYWVSGLHLIRAGLFVSLLFTTVMEFQQQQFGALVDFAIVVFLLALTGAAMQAVQRGEIVPRKLPRKQRAQAEAELAAAPRVAGVPGQPVGDTAAGSATERPAPTPQRAGG